MGMQKTVTSIVNIREALKENKNELIKCSSCGRDAKTFFRNTMNTLECYCGVKFYGH